MNLETGKKDEISFPDQTVIRLIGFVGTDLVYGLAHPNEQLTMDGRVTGASAVCGRDRWQQYGDGDPL